MSEAEKLYHYYGEDWCYGREHFQKSLTDVENETLRKHGFSGLKKFWNNDPIGLSTYKRQRPWWF